MKPKKRVTKVFLLSITVFLFQYRLVTGCEDPMTVAPRKKIKFNRLAVHPEKRLEVQ